MADPRTPPATNRSGPIDCDIHPGMTSLAELKPFLAQKWQVHLDTYGPSTRQTFHGATTYPRMAHDTARADAWPPSGKPPGADLDFMREQHLDAHDVAYGILQPLRPGAASERNPDFGIALCHALNAWQLARWCEPEPRLRGSIVVPVDDTAAAVAEIGRWAGHPAFVQVTLPPKSPEPLGRRRYWPIYEAAAAAGLPIGMHVSGVSGSAISAGGWPSYYVEDHNANVHAMQATVTSLIFEGVTTRWPGLRFVLIEGGVGWAPVLGHRLDHVWSRFRTELPHLTETPSRHLRRNFAFTTQPIEEPPTQDMLVALLRDVGTERILYSSDYPHWDYDDPRYALPGKLDAGERRAILRDNAAALFGLSL